MSKAYYNRTLRGKLVKIIEDKYSWMLDYVKQHPELDFQTGTNARTSWFQVYRGTSSLLKIGVTGRISASPAYVSRCPDFYDNPSPESFDRLLEIVNQTPKFDRYYSDPLQAKKREGYYQNLISRRYTLFTEPDDDFIVIDKECVIGFENTRAEEEWNASIKKELQECLIKARTELRDISLPQDIKTEFGEIDFLALTWDGDIIIMELKGNDPEKTYLSPIQIGYYFRQFSKLLGEIPDLYNGMKEMIQQKIDLGILNLPAGKALPSSLSGEIKNYLIVGEEQNLSPEICRRYSLFRHYFNPNMEAYTCTENGELMKSPKLHYL